MADSIAIDLVKLRSERTRQQLFRAYGVVCTAAKLVDNVETDNDISANDCAGLYQALTLAAETLDAAAWTLDGDAMTKAPTGEEQRELAEESEARS